MKAFQLGRGQAGAWSIHDPINKLRLAFDVFLKRTIVKPRYSMRLRSPRMPHSTTKGWGIRQKAKRDLVAACSARPEFGDAGKLEFAEASP
jgi:hypothetical protein